MKTFSQRLCGGGLSFEFTGSCLETAPTAGTAEPKGQGKGRDRPTDPELRCLALTGEDFGRLVEAVGPEAVVFDPVSSEAAETEAAAAGVK